ncbi:transcription factor E4F1 [Callorhinchus milii]|uniref:Transcription factor E4F1 n=1 Tax=Callorhinchus milii TaxID=7868 RepID=A0A4W3H2J3_CALMI|nr:transcription factor E4F1 [Callorhinchus milii]
MSSAHTAAAAPGAGGEEEDVDLHKCGRCHTEFHSLEDFIGHKVQKACQRLQEQSVVCPDTIPVSSQSRQESDPVGSSVAVAQLVVATPETTYTLHSDETGNGCENGGQSSEERVSGSAEQEASESEESPVSPEAGDHRVKRNRLDTVLNEDGRFVCQICVKTFKTAVILKAHMVTHSDNKAFRCKMCGMAFRTKGSLVRHNRRHTDERPYRCQMCGMSFRESGALTRHLKAITPCTEKNKFQQLQLVSEPETEATAMGKPQPQTVSEKQSEELVCPEATAVISVLTNAEGTIQEVQVHSVPETLLPETQHRSQSPTPAEMACSGEAASESLICQAMRNSGIVIETVIIEDAEKCSESVSLGEDGDSPEHEAQTQEVEEANESDSSSRRGCRRFKCPHCSREFRGSSYLRLHIKAHLGYKPHRCSLCEKEFMTAYILKKHLESHYNERRFKCGECGKLYKSIAHVKEHMRAHSDHRPYPCPCCGKSYKTKNAQQVHLRTHSEAKPFVCEHCPRAFREKGSLVRHVRLHTGERPFHCYNCGRGFAEHGTLNRHLRAKGGCHVLEQVEISSDGQSVDGVAGISSDDSHTVLVEFSSVVADTQEYIIESPAEAVGSSDVETLIRGSKHQVDSHIMKVVQQIVNQANCGQQIIAESLSAEDGADTITIATPDSLTEQVAMTLASTISEGSSLESSPSTLTMVTAADLQVLGHAEEYVVTGQEGEVEIQTVVVGD